MFKTSGFQGEKFSHKNLSLLALAALSAVPGIAQVPTAVLSEGSPIGPNSVTIEQLFAPSLNGVGGWVVRPKSGSVNSTDPNQSTDFFFGKLTGAASPALLREEASYIFPVIGQVNQLSLGTPRINDVGQTAYTSTLTEFIPRQASIWLDNNVIVRSSDPLPTGLGYDGQFFGRQLTVGGLANNGDMIIRSTINPDSTLPNTSDVTNVILRRSASGGYTKLLESGQVIPGQGTISPTENTSVSLSSVSSDLSFYTASVDLNAAPTSQTLLLMKNGVPDTTFSGTVLKTGNAIPVSDGGLAGETFNNFSSPAVNNQGVTAVRVDVGNTPDPIDEAVMIAGRIAYRESDVLDGKTLGGLVNNVTINNQNDVAYSFSTTGLFINNIFVAGFGTLVDTDGNGSADTPLDSFTSAGNVSISDRDAAGNIDIYFLGRVNLSSRDTIYRVTMNTGSSLWTRDGSGIWEGYSNWRGAIPSAARAIANFTTDLTADSTVTLLGSKTIGAMNFNSTNSYTLSGGSIVFDNGASSAQVNVLTGNHVVLSPVTLLSDLTLNVSAEMSLSFEGAFTLPVAQNITKTGSGQVNLTAVKGAGLLSVTGGFLDITSVNDTLAVQSISVAPGTTLNLNDNDLIVDYTGASPLASLLADIADSKLVSLTDVGGIATLLVLFEAADFGLTEFNGIAVDADAVIGKFTYTGDANLDGQVDAFDYSIIDDNFGSPGTFITGDLNQDGFVDAFDYSSIDDTFGAGVGNPLRPPLSPAASTEVFIPEPASLSLLALAGGLMARRRR